MSLYTFFNFISCVVLLIYNLLHFKEKKQILSSASKTAIKRFESKSKKNILSNLWFYVIGEILIISMLQYCGTSWLNIILGDIVNTGANYYGLMFFAPPLVVIFCLLVKIDPLSQMDLITPAYPLALIFVKIACYFAGCCRGIPWEHGFFNPVSRQIEFPIQLLESLVALLIFVILILVKNKLKKGTVFPVYLIVYSSIRFFTEFLRAEPEVFIGLKAYQILCIVGIVVGIFEYFAACKYNSWTQGKGKKRHIEKKWGGDDID